MASMYEPGFDYDAYVRDLVATGRYDDERDVMRTALRLLHDEETIRAQRLAELEALLEPAMAEIDAGLGIPIEEVSAHFEARVAALRQSRDAAE